MKKIEELYKKYFGVSPTLCVKLPGAGGNRAYYRLSSSGMPDVIGVEGDSDVDCEAFIALSQVFRKSGINVPEVYCYSADKRLYLQQDLGNVSLFSLLNDDEKGKKFVIAAMKQLARMQTVPRNVWLNSVLYPPFSRRQVMWDLNYFKYEFLRVAEVEYDENQLENDFENFAENLVGGDNVTGFMYRDFQSRNVMVDNDDVWFIDYQGGREGPVLYDAISFLWQAKAGFSSEFRNEMLKVWALELRRNMPGVNAEQLLGKVKQFALFRTLQVLGAYGFRGLVQKRAHFIESIPGALQNLKELIDDGAGSDYPMLELVARRIIESGKFKEKAHDGLLIKVFSFSYKKGYPEDYTGNGGGFMFDCRGMHNPGRYQEFKNLTGRDEPVSCFLRERGEADMFAQRAVEIVAPSVETYLRRGFSNLQIGFGCTGGQHRSVYCAEKVARELAMRYPEATVRLIHREQGMEETL